jgi:L-rhamnose isomerase
MKFRPTDQQIDSAYEIAKERYAALGVDVEVALDTLKTVAISLHCWQGDDVSGFEDPDRALSGGIMATGNYPGKATTVAELRSDLDKAYSLIPGNHRLNLHASYLDSEEKVARNEIQPEHFSTWVDWAKENNHGIDFNPTLFSHPLADDGFTLAHADKGIRDFWIEHCIASREVGAYIGKELGSPVINNIWIPDGYKDMPADRYSPRVRLKDALDEIFAKPLDPAYHKDAVECKLFGLGSESYVVGSHEFYMGYAIANQTVLCIDAGHFHPTETISDKISSVMLYVPEVLLHVSRGVRWDSDHVVTLTDDLQAIMQEIARGDFLDRVHIGLDFFDASINRVGAWAIGTRNAVRAMMLALLEPRDLLRQYENDGNFTARLALIEELKGLPFGAIWDYYCRREGVPVGMSFMEEISAYEDAVLSKRS